MLTVLGTLIDLETGFYIAAINYKTIEQTPTISTSIVGLFPYVYFWGFSDNIKRATIYFP